jgi:hypothetical protein
MRSRSPPRNRTATCAHRACIRTGVVWLQTPTATARQEDPMTALDIDVHSEALFVSHVQRSQEPSAELIRAAVNATVDRLGEVGCAELVAQEFGEHPDCALGRMQWARRAARSAFSMV